MEDKRFEKLLDTLTKDKDSPIDTIDIETKEILDKMASGKIKMEDAVGEFLKNKK